MILAKYAKPMGTSTIKDNDMAVVDEWLNLQTSEVILQQWEPRGSSLLCRDWDESRVF
jgi:hypothetical protein